MEELIFSKGITQTAIDHGLCIPTEILHVFPPFGEGNHVQHLIFNDMEVEETVWNLRLSVRQEGPPKPVFEGDWVRFVKNKGLKLVDQVLFFRVIHANGEVTYKIKPFYNFMKV
ncbi:hypothetical protein Pint_09620 [Pistacia integerrima]|uniref:Uncharacterized protein n=1 Tax=Pistacia integerrima TaxID=434235 RepID=A0ACC0XI44_9ROSI|nr:hypothetical protein Pint_09620 [Pistacia integerrima]